MYGNGVLQISVIYRRLTKHNSNNNNNNNCIIHRMGIHFELRRLHKNVGCWVPNFNVIRYTTGIQCNCLSSGSNGEIYLCLTIMHNAQR